MNLMLRVALFLRDEISLSYDLIPSDVAILLMLASHLGEKDLWYISQPELAKECRLKTRQFIYRAKKLETQKLIAVTRTGKANGYGITLPKHEGKLWSSDMHSTAYQRVDKSITKIPDVHSSAEQICTTVQNRYAPECIHKETVNKQKKTERARTKRAPLSHSWLPNEQNIITAREVSSKVGKSIDQLITKFRNLQISKEATSTDWNRNFENFLIDERVPAMLGNGHAAPVKPPKSKDWTMERIAREEAEAKNGIKAQEAPIYVPEPVTEYVPYKEMRRRYLLKQQGELTDEEAITGDTVDHNGGGTSSH